MFDSWVPDCLAGLSVCHAGALNRGSAWDRRLCGKRCGFQVGPSRLYRSTSSETENLNGSWTKIGHFFGKPWTTRNTWTACFYSGYFYEHDFDAAVYGYNEHNRCVIKSTDVESQHRSIFHGTPTKSMPGDNLTNVKPKQTIAAATNTTTNPANKASSTH